MGEQSEDRFPPPWQLGVSLAVLSGFYLLIRACSSPLSLYSFSPAVYGYGEALGPRQWLPEWLWSCALPSAICCYGFQRANRRATAAGNFPSPTVVIIVVLLALSLTRLFVFNRPPSSVDEFSYNYQAELSSSFRLSAQPPSLVLPFDADGLVRLSDRITSAWQPGWPFVLALFKVIGIGCLANVILFCLLLFLCREFARTLWGDSAGKAGALVLACLSPFWILGMGDFPHLLVLVLTVWSWLLYLKFKNGGKWGLLALLTLAWSLLACCRLQDILCPAVVVLLWCWNAGKDGDRRPFLPCLLPLLFAISASALVNFQQIGGVLLPTQLVYTNFFTRINSFEVLVDKIHDPCYTLARVLWWTGPLLVPFLLSALWKKGNPNEVALKWGFCAQLLLTSLKDGLPAIDWCCRYYSQSLLILALLGGAELSRRKLEPTVFRTALLVTVLAGMHAVFLCSKEYDRLIIPPRLKPGLYFFRQMHPGIVRRSQIRNSPDLTPPISVQWADDETNRRVSARFSDLDQFVVDYLDGEYRIVPLPR